MMYLKRSMAVLAFVLVFQAAYAAPSAAVLDFEYGDYYDAQRSSVMSDLFRNELVRSGRIDIVDRSHMAKIVAEFNFQMNDWTNPARVKRFGQMIGADFLVCGKFDMLGRQLYLIVQMIDVETGRVAYSDRLAVDSWDDYDRNVQSLASGFVKKFPQGNRFVGEWEAGIDNWDFTIILMSSNTCVFTISTEQNGEHLKETVKGTWSFDDEVIRIAASFPRSTIRGLRRIDWRSVYTFINSDESVFNAVVTPPGGKASRVTFSRTVKWD